MHRSKPETLSRPFWVRLWAIVSSVSTLPDLRLLFQLLLSKARGTMLGTASLSFLDCQNLSWLCYKMKAHLTLTLLQAPLETVDVKLTSTLPIILFLVWTTHSSTDRWIDSCELSKIEIIWHQFEACPNDYLLNLAIAVVIAYEVALPNTKCCWVTVCVTFGTAKWTPFRLF